MDIIYKTSYEQIKLVFDFANDMTMSDEIISTYAVKYVWLTADNLPIDVTGTLESSKTNGNSTVTLNIVSGTAGYKYLISVDMVTNYGNSYKQLILLIIDQKIIKAFNKPADENVYISIDFSNEVLTDTINSKTVTAVDLYDGSSVTSTIIDASAIDGKLINIGVKAGTAGRTYQITTKVDTNNSTKFQKDILLFVNSDFIDTTTTATKVVFIDSPNNSDFMALSQTSRAWRGMASAPNGNVYACVYGGDIYMQTGGEGDFVALNQTSRNYQGMVATSAGDIYVCVYGGDIYKQTNGTGDFVALNQTSRDWHRMTVHSNGDVYCTVYDGDIYKQTGGTGSFLALSQTSRSWTGITVAPNGNVYACVYGGDIYMQTGGSGNFIALSQTSRNWRGMAAASNGNIYAAVNSGSIYMQTGGSGDFITLSQTSRLWIEMEEHSNGDIYASVDGGDIYKQMVISTSETLAIPPNYVRVQIQNVSSAGVSTAGVLITMSLASGTGVLNGTKQKATDSSGYAIFDDLNLSTVGAKTITASCLGLTSATSGSFTIS